MTRFILFFLAVMPVLADVQFKAARMTRDDVPLGKGQCDIHLEIDKDAEIRVRGDSVSVRTPSGREARDIGSECNEPLPGPGLRAFNFEARDGRGEMILLSAPSERNGYTAVVRIRDSAGGAARYFFRLSWRIDGGGFSHAGPPRENSFGMKEAIEVCQEAVVSRIVDQYHFGDADIRGIRADDRPGRNDYVVGEAIARRGFNRGRFTFVCGVDFHSGRVRSVDVRQR